MSDMASIVKWNIRDTIARQLFDFALVKRGSSCVTYAK